MAPTVNSPLFEEIRSVWPNRPYPLVVDHVDVAEGRVCPAASLYALGKSFGDALKAASVEPGEVVACFPRTWTEWIGMLQACLRRGAGFAPLEPGRPRGDWADAVGASLRLDPDGVTRGPKGRRVAPGTAIFGPPAVALTEPELLDATEPRVVDPVLSAEDSVWLDDRLLPVAKAMAVLTLLRARAEVHLGLDTSSALERAADEHRLFDGAGTSSSVAAARAWGEAAS
jgi:hypothetical protein